MKRVLIIEDDPVITRIYRILLTKEGYRVEFCSDGQSGLERIRASNPDVVLLDLMLPKLNGIGVLKRVRSEARFKKTPIIIFTNAHIPGAIEQAFLAGATKVFNKATAQPKEILEALKQALVPTPSSSATDSGDESKSAPATASEPMLEIVDDASVHSQPAFSAPNDAEATGVSEDEIRDETAEDLLVPEEAEEMDDAEFQADLFKSFVDSVPATVAALRHLVEGLSKAKDQASRSKQVLELYRKLHGLTGGAGMAGFLNVSTFGAVVEALLKELREQPKSLNASTLRTLTQAIDFLSELCANSPGKASTDQTDFKVLVVDDEILSRRAIIYSLGKAGLKATSVEEAQSALKLAGEKPFDLIVVDSQMTDVDGRDLAANLQAAQKNKHTPVLLVAPLTAFKRLGKSNSSEGPDLIGKPFLFIELAVKALTSLLRSQLQQTSRSCGVERHAA